jgi:hypothetical protein
MKSGWFWGSDCPRVKLHKIKKRTAEPQNIDIRFFKVSFSIRLAAFQAGGAVCVVTHREQGGSDLAASGLGPGFLLENEYAGHPKQYICNTGSKFSIFHGL